MKITISNFLIVVQLGSILVLTGCGHNNISITTAGESGACDDQRRIKEMLNPNASQSSDPEADKTACIADLEEGRKDGRYTFNFAGGKTNSDHIYIEGLVGIYKDSVHSYSVPVKRDDNGDWHPPPYMSP